MGLEFISRIIKTTLILALLAFVFGSVYYDFSEALGCLVGAAWGVLNLYAIKSLITEVITPDRPRKSVALVLALIKFPLLYAVGYFLLSLNYFSPESLLVGFSLMFAVAFLKVLGRVILGMDTIDLKRKQAEENS
jgi:hypothetical protein